MERLSFIFILIHLDSFVLGIKRVLKIYSAGSNINNRICLLINKINI